jgi:hypothetical protein
MEEHMAVCVITLPVGISRAREKEDIKALREVFGDFEFIDFNVMSLAENAFSIRIKRSRVPKAGGGVMDVDETVGGLLFGRLRLTYGERVEFSQADPDWVKVRFTSHEP